MNIFKKKKALSLKEQMEKLTRNKFLFFNAWSDNIIIDDNLSVRGYTGGNRYYHFEAKFNDKNYKVLINNDLISLEHPEENDYLINYDLIFKKVADYFSSDSNISEQLDKLNQKIFNQRDQIKRYQEELSKMIEAKKELSK